MAFYVHRKPFTGFDLKGTTGKDGSLYGIIRTSLKDGPTSVSAFCGIFETDPARQKFYFYGDSLFFFGTLDELAKNFRRGIPEHLELEQYLNKGYQGDYVKFSAHQQGKSGFYLIPQQEMKLASPRRSLITSVIPRIKENLLKILEEIVECTLPEGDKEIHRAFNSAYNHMPQELKDHAQEQKIYYRLVGSRERTQKGKTIIHYQNMEAAAEPLLTAPDWVNKYVESERKING